MHTYEFVIHDLDAAMVTYYLGVMTITNRQIKTLRSEAVAAGDGLQAQLCTVALATGPGEIAEIDEDYRSDLERLGVIPEHVGSDVIARQLCADVIDAAAAMSGR